MVLPPNCSLKQSVKGSKRPMARILEQSLSASSGSSCSCWRNSFSRSVRPGHTEKRWIKYYRQHGHSREHNLQWRIRDEREKPASLACMGLDLWGLMQLKVSHIIKKQTNRQKQHLNHWPQQATKVAPLIPNRDQKSLILSQSCYI